MTNYIKIEKVSAEYNGKKVLDNVNLDIKKGDFIGIIGPNGGGKTTLLKLILGLKKVYSGNINIANGLTIGYLPQQNNIDKMFPISVYDVVMSGLMNIDSKQNITDFRKLKKRYHERAMSLMEKMNILDISQKAIGKLSGGQMQKAFLCRALISNPELLLLDEPNTYIDKESEFEFYDYLTNESNVDAFLLVSHDLGTISSYIKSIACVNISLHYHQSNIITEELLEEYGCPIQLVTHGKVPHTVLENHCCTHKH